MPPRGDKWKDIIAKLNCYLSLNVNQIKKIYKYEIFN